MLLNGNAKKLSIMIADDHALVSEAIASVLSARADFDVNTVSSGHAALAALKAGTPVNILLLDIGMPGMNGIESVTEFIKLMAPGYVVIFSAISNPEFVRKAIGLGARGFIPKSIPLGALESILRLIATGQIYVPIELSSMKNNGSESSPLNEREKSVLDYISKGKSNKEIALAMDTSEVTIKTLMRGICKKLDVKNRTEAAMTYMNFSQA